MTIALPASPAGPEDGPRLDAVDRQLLRLLQDSGRTTNRELARQVDLSPPALQKRVQKLQDAGVIQRYTALIDREAVGLDLLCFVQVTLAHHEPESVQGFREQVGEIPEVLECHHLTGEFDYLMKVVVRNHKDLERFLFEKLTSISGVDKIRTSIVLRQIKESTVLPIDD